MTVYPPDFPRANIMGTLITMFEMTVFKTVEFSKCLEYLGIVLDNDKMEARLQHDKLQGVLEALSTFLERKSCTKRHLLILLGHLYFACRVLRPSRSFVSYLVSLSTIVSELHRHVTVTLE